MNKIETKLLEILNNENNTILVIPNEDGYVLLFNKKLLIEDNEEDVSIFMKLKRASETHYKLYLVANVLNIPIDTLIGDVDITAELDEKLNEMASAHISMVQNDFLSL